MLTGLGEQQGSSSRTAGYIALVLLPLGFLVGIGVHYALEDEKKKTVGRFFAIHDARRKRMAAAFAPTGRRRRPRMTRVAARRLQVTA